MGGVRIVVDDLSGPAIAEFLAEHLRQMQETSPPESKHALDLDGLRRPEVTFWTMLDAAAGMGPAGGELVGCGALLRLDAVHAEVKSMRVAPARRGEGLASLLLAHIIAEARQAGYARLSLETGSMDFFAPARRLYARHGFTACAPFAGYRADPNSVFMTREL